VLVDGGFRRGTMSSRLLRWVLRRGHRAALSLGIGGVRQSGVVRIMEILRAELAADMGMAGTGTIPQIDRSFVRVRHEGSNESPGCSRSRNRLDVRTLAAPDDEAGKILRPANNSSHKTGPVDLCC